MEFEVKEPLKLEDGKHLGVVTRIEYREEPYKYTDIYIKPEGTEMEIKYGCPSVVKSATKLGKLLEKFTELKPGEKIDPEKVLVGRNVDFVTVTEEGKDGNSYARIADKSIKPSEEKVEA